MAEFKMAGGFPRRPESSVALYGFSASIHFDRALPVPKIFIGRFATPELKAFTSGDDEHALAFSHYIVNNPERFFFQLNHMVRHPFAVHVMSGLYKRAQSASLDFQRRIINARSLNGPVFHTAVMDCSGDLSLGSLRISNGEIRIKTRELVLLAALYIGFTEYGSIRESIDYLIEDIPRVQTLLETVFPAKIETQEQPLDPAELAQNTLCAIREREALKDLASKMGFTDIS